MSEIRSMLVDTVNKVLKDICTKELVTEAEKGEWPEQLWNTMEELGVTTVGIDDEKGGAGGDLGDAMALLKVAGAYAAPIPLAENIIANWILSTVNLPIASGPVTFAPVCITDVITFEEAAGGWVLSGKASFVPWARHVKKIVVIGSTSDNRKIVANVDAENCLINNTDNLAGEPRDEIVFENLKVDNENAAELDSVIFDAISNLGALARVVQMTGALEKTLELSVTYTKERTQFGRPISKFQAIQQQLAILAGEVTASMVVADFVLNQIDHDISREEVMMAKIQLGEATGVATRIAHQVHGAMGFTDEHPLHQSTRRLWAWRDEFGTESELARELGKAVLAKGAKQLWPFVTKARLPVTERS